MTKEEQLSDVVLEALSHLVCSDEVWEERGERAEKRALHLRPATYDGFEPMHPAAGNTLVLLGRDPLDQPVWPIDVAYAGLNTSDGWQSGTWQFTRVRTLDKRDWRGRIALYSPRMLEVFHSVSEPNGKRKSMVAPLALLRNRTLDARATYGSGFRIDAPPVCGYGLPPSSFPLFRQHRGPEDEIDFLVRAAGGFALRREYLWSVLLGEGRGPRARFMTDPAGAREAFRLRDAPPGKARRAALKHWVRSHWRGERKDAEADRIWVREHLRGAEEFVWNGLRCRIEPSKEDARRAEAASDRTRTA